MRIRPFERLRFNPPPEPGHAPSRSFGAVFRYPHGSTSLWLFSSPFVSEAHRASLEPSRPGRTNGPSLNRSAALMGFSPSQVYSRNGWDCISAFPGPPAVRAARPYPIDFRRGDRTRPVGVLIEPGRDEWIGGSWRSTSGLRSRLRSAPAGIFATEHVPALGFASCRVGGHVTRASARARPRFGSSASGSTRRARQAAYPLLGLGDPSHTFRVSVNCHRFTRR